MSTYYTCIDAKTSGYERLLEPPFRVIKHVPGAGVLVSLGEDGIAALREVFADIATDCRNRDDGSIHPAIWLHDDNLNFYELTESTFEPLGFKQRPDWRRGIIRSMKVNARRRAKAARYRERDVAACAKLTRPAVHKGRQSLVWFPFYRHYKYAKPGGDGQFRLRFRRARGKKPLPLLIYLHGAGSFGYNGIMSMNEFTALWLGLRKARQRCHVLVPQLPLRGDGYEDDAWSQSLTEVIDWIAETTGTLDRSRIFITGTSYGGYGAIMECLRHPERCAACVTAVAALANLGRPLEDEDYDALAKTPLWLGYSRDEKKLNEPLYEALSARGADVRRTYLQRFGHGLGGPVFWMTKPWAKWLFSHKKAAGE